MSALTKEQEQQSKEFYALYFDPGRWFQFPKPLLKIKVRPKARITKAQAQSQPRSRHKTLKPLEYGPLILLAYLINFHYRTVAINEGKLLDGEVVEYHDGFFYCKTRTITHEIGMSKDALCAMLPRLVECGFLELMTKGMPPKRFIRINFGAILSAINDGLSSPD